MIGLLVVNSNNIICIVPYGPRIMQKRCKIICSFYNY